MSAAPAVPPNSTLGEVLAGVPAPGPAPSVYQVLPLELLVPSKTNPRKSYDGVLLAELAKSIKDHGVVEPLLVRPQKERFEIVAGERRFRAAKIAEASEVPVIIRELTDEQALEIQVIENLQRSDLHPLEEAQGYRQLQATAKYDVGRIAERIGRSIKYVYDRMKLLDLTEDVKALFLDGTITAGHAILLARLQPADQKRAMTDMDGLLDHEDLLWDPTDRGTHRDVKKARSVRELAGWIDEHVRFEPKDADPMLFPDTALKLTEARGEKAKVIAITHDHFVQEEARAEGERTYGPQSWKRADGQRKSKPCSFSVLGVIAAGYGRGEAFDVCTAKEKCKVHWAEWQREREKRAKAAAAAGGSTSAAARSSAAREESRWKREEEKRREEQKRQQAALDRWKKAAPAILEAVAAAVKKAPTKATGLLATLILERCQVNYHGKNLDHGRFVPRGTSAEDLVRHAAFVVLADEVLEWTAPEEFPKRARAFGLDVTKILNEAAPVAKPAPEPEKKKAAKTSRA